MRIWPLAHALLDDDLLPESAGVHHHRKTQEEGASTPSFCVAIFAHELSLGSTPIAESQGGLSQLCVEVIGRYLNPNSLIPDNRLFSLSVLRAHDVPRIKKQFGPKRRFFVTVTNHATVKKTENVQIDGQGQVVHWNQRLGVL